MDIVSERENSCEHKTVAYRPDIDGLRALAVCFVVCYHAFPATVKAGFIGVDIFFVISGYLIGGIILTNLQANEFSYGNFYFRRILRIFPALILVFLGVLIAGYICLLPDEFKNLGLSVLTGGFFVENFLLWKSAGYFDTAAHAKPLLNLWSLGIEEQFYIIFPLLLLFCWKKKLRIFSILAILTLISLTDCIWLRALDPTADFYSPLTRIWELFVGCMLKAMEMSPRYGTVRGRVNRIFSKIFYRESTNSQDGFGLFLALLGLCTLGFSSIRIMPGSWYPGWLALLPVCAALCLIGAGQTNFISHYLFCNRAAIFIGKISYPLYLWHWPLLSFAWIINGHLDSSTCMLRAALVLTAFLLACMTYLFVERPVRLKRCLGRASMPILIGGMFCCCSAGLWIYHDQGFPERVNIKIARKALEMLSKPSYEDEFRNEAGLKYIGGKARDFTYYRYNDIGQRKTIAIYGDSHANAAYSGIAELGKELAKSGKGFNTLLLGVPGKGVINKQSFNTFLDIISKHPEIKQVFLINRGTALMKALNDPSKNDGVGMFRDSYKEKIGKLLQIGKEVIIVAENPELNHDIRSAIKRGVSGITINRDLLNLMKKDEVVEKEKSYLEIINELEKIPGVNVLESYDAFCPVEECLAFDDMGIPLYFDNHHLSRAGSTFQAQKIIKPWFLKR